MREDRDCGKATAMTVKERALELLKSGTVARVMGYRKGEFEYDHTPSLFETAEDIGENFVFDEYSGANLSKYMISASRAEGKTAVFLKPCDTYSFAQLVKEHRIIRENVYAVGVQCDGMYGEGRVLLGKCETCKSKKMIGCDELIGEQGEDCDTTRFEQVEKLEKMTAKERYEFFKGELGRCIRCNACRNVCPACSCETCVFDNPDMIRNKAAADSFEDNLFHVIRAFHVAGRCTDCGECSRVCPEHIPLHLLNRKFIKDINEFYGEYQAGADPDSIPPLYDFTKEDLEPREALNLRGEQ